MPGPPNPKSSQGTPIFPLTPRFHINFHIEANIAKFSTLIYVFVNPQLSLSKDHEKFSRSNISLKSSNADSQLAPWTHCTLPHCHIERLLILLENKRSWLRIFGDPRDSSTNVSYELVTYGPPGTKGLNCYGYKMVVN